MSARFTASRRASRNKATEASRAGHSETRTRQSESARTRNRALPVFMRNNGDTASRGVSDNARSSADRDGGTEHAGSVPRFMQARLEIGAVNDPHERQASEAAHRAMQMPGTVNATWPAPGSPSSRSGVTAPPSVHEALHSPGQPLDSATRGFMEDRFHHDFSQVRVHTGASASASAKAVNAKAYTVGNDLVFGSGKYSPSTAGGRQLLAHELAHVTQQSSDVLRRAPEDEANSPEQMRLPPKGINPEQDLPRSSMEEAKLSWAVSHKVITFILGPDSDKFYKAAHEYWKQPGRTDVLVTNQRSLTGVLDYLNDPKHAPPNGRSWGQLNLVTHANEEGGMGIKFSPESGNNISPEELEQKITAGGIPKVDGGVVDRNTAINVHGCALGRDPQMLKELSEAISGGKSSAYAPKDLQAYRYSVSGKSETTEEYLVEYWAVGFPAGQAHSQKQLIKEFDEQFGSGPGVDWKKAVPKAHRTTEPFHFQVTFGSFLHIPAKSDRAGHARLLSHEFPESASWTRWSVASQSTVPDGAGSEKTTIDYKVHTTDEHQKPVDMTFTITESSPIIPRSKKDQEQFMRDQIGADKADRFSWTMSGGRLPKSGTRSDVKITLEGRRTMVRVERDLKDAQGAHQHPSREDPAHYGSYKP